MEFIVDTTDWEKEIIVTVDKNEHMVQLKLSKRLRNIGLIEAYLKKLKSKFPLHILEVSIR